MNAINFQCVDCLKPIETGGQCDSCKLINPFGFHLSDFHRSLGAAMAADTSETYRGRQKIDEATLERFAIKLVFPLTLNKDDRAAIDWIGHRYSHGDELAEFLCDCLPQGHSYEDFNFSDIEGDVQFDIPESEMEEYERLITEDSMACFSDELKHKLMLPLHHFLGGR